jgi:NADPH:quinone reductase-like Zn-dependent oxidoreductase
MFPGAEGVGKIIKAGTGVRHVQPGDRVLLPGPGCWRERFRAPAKQVFALPGGVDARQLAMLRVNPPTAYLMLHQFVAPKAGQWAIQNAANSGVGHCLIRLARLAGVKTVNVVRREALVAPLRAAGGDVVLTDGPDRICACAPPSATARCRSRSTRWEAPPRSAWPGACRMAARW